VKLEPKAGWPVVAARLHHHEVENKVSRSPSTHSYAVLVFCTEGEARVELNGVWKLQPGDALLIPAGAPHRMVERKRQSFWGMSFCVPCFVADGAAALLEPFERVRDGAAAVVRIPEARRVFFGGLFRELERVGKTQAHELDAVRRSLLTLILSELEQAMEHGKRAGGGVAVDALRFIERNCLGALTLKEVAKAVHRTPAYVTTALKKATGRSAVQWIISGRMAEARRLLLHSDERVDVIAERVGYADATHFIRLFRRENGVTPAAWRARQSRG
jgi:AraC family transcriptional activator of pobA